MNEKKPEPKDAVDPSKQVEKKIDLFDLPPSLTDEEPPAPPPSPDTLPGLPPR